AVAAGTAAASGDRPGDPATAPDARRPLRLAEIFRIPGAKAVLLCFFCYCAIEQTAGLWAATFLAHRGVDPERAAFYASMVYLGITLGRAVGGFATFKWNDDQMLRIGEGIVVAGLALVGAAALVPAVPSGVACAGFVVAGFGCAPVYPSIIHSTPAHFGADKSQAIIGVQMAFAYLGTTAMPPLFGVLARRLSPALLPLYLLALLVLMALLYERVVRITARQRTRRG
ncbi:MAG: MFS transporter, partial [Kiritimatiellae bacterium]|nr:MFS transporter [Kiritimatiellia bacterium]